MICIKLFGVVKMLQLITMKMVFGIKLDLVLKNKKIFSVYKGRK